MSGAIAETRRQWEDLRQQLLTAYGPRRGALIVCAITRDDPIDDCRGRRLGIVIDSSGSNQETDPSGLRIAAGQAFNASLVTQAEVEREGRGKPDQSAGISFSDSSGAVSALADPSLADQPPPFRRFGIVIGIRTSIGFLAPPPNPVAAWAGRWRSPSPDRARCAPRFEWRGRAVRWPGRARIEVDAPAWSWPRGARGCWRWTSRPRRTGR